MKKANYCFALIICIFVCVLCCGCFSKPDYKQWSTIDNFDTTDIFLQKGKSETIDFDATFKKYGIEVSKITATSDNEQVFTVKENTVYATGLGKALLKVEVFDKYRDTYFLVVFANVYVWDIESTELIKIYSAQDLANMNSNKSAKYILAKDIDLKDWGEWIPIGNLPLNESDAHNKNSFCGWLINPNGYKISNLTISSSEHVPHGIYGGCQGGLFGSVNEAYIDGLILENVQIDIADFERSNAGGICATYLNSVVRNCSVKGNLHSTNYCGGIIGSANWGKIIGCKFEGTIISDNSSAGGIAGLGYVVENCSASGSVEGKYSAGGILGYGTYKYSVTNCTFAGELLGDGFKNSSVAAEQN